MSTLIIVHPGKAHFDEFLAVSLILAVHPDIDFKIERRNPTPVDLDNPAVWVVDAGGRYEPVLKNFDHHQDMDLSASFALVAAYLKLDRKFEVMPWWGFKERIDRFGPFKLAEELGIDSLEVTHSPVESWFVGLFEQDPNRLCSLMQSFGQKMIAEADHLRSQFDFWQTCDTTLLRDQLVLIGLTDDSTGIQRYSDKLEVPVSIAITYDDRNDGWKLKRLKDAGDVDFSKLDGHTEIRFAHKNGFLAKTKRRLPLEGVMELVGLAMS